VDFLIIGAGAAGRRSAAARRKGFSVVILEAGPSGARSRISPRRLAQQNLFWTTTVSSAVMTDRARRNNSGRGVGGSTVHYSMIALRFRPDWFKSKSRLGYGFDWPITYEELAPYYEEVEER